MDLIVRVAGSDAERADAFAVRRRVFIDEQGVDAALERDQHDYWWHRAGASRRRDDDACAHLIALDGGRVVGAARYRHTERGVKLERVAVLAELRGRGVGRQLVRDALALLPAGSEVYVHAQHSALGFWQRMGFVAEGPPFDEAGIPHRLMRVMLGASGPGLA